MEKLSEQEIIRRDKLAKYKELGIDPFGQKFDVTGHSVDIKNEYKDMSHEELEEKTVDVAVAGRIMFIRKWVRLLSLLFKIKKALFKFIFARI